MLSFAWVLTLLLVYSGLGTCFLLAGCFVSVWGGLCCLWVCFVGLLLGLGFRLLVSVIITLIGLDCFGLKLDSVFYCFS